MIVHHSLALYNPSGLGDDEFIASFVARHELLETLLRRLRTAEPEGGGRHYVLIGPRGMGKTSLLKRIKIAIGQEPDLAARYVPLSFREEQYNVQTLGDFWRNCGESLAGWAEASGRVDLAHRLDADLMTDAWANDEAAAEQFNAEMATIHRRAVLLVDNIDLIIDALAQSDSNWILRRHLQAKHGPIVIGAATQLLKQGVDRNAAFYEFFEPEYLDPLDQHQTGACMRALARGRGGDGDHVIAVLNKQPERLKTLHTLTGGNPRVITLIYQLLEAGRSEAAMSDLEILLDQVTPYYKARIEEYQTPQQRAVIDAIALHWDPVTTGDLARVTNIATTTLSPLLIRLRKDGLIENVETSGAYAGHQLVERFFNIWYLMRHGTRRTKQKMRWLVAFLTTFYSSRELADLARRADDNGVRKGWRTDYALAFNEAERLSSKSEKNGKFGDSSPEMTAPAELVGTSLGNGKPLEDSRSIEASGLARQAFEYWQAADYLRCSAALNELLARFGDAPEPALREQVAEALGNKGLALRQMGDYAAAVAACDEVLARFGDAPEPTLREQVARALVNKGVALDQMGHYAAAVAVCDEVLARFGDASEPALREQVGSALGNKGVALARMGDYAAAISTFERLLGLSDSASTALQPFLAEARLHLANLLLDFREEFTRAETLYRDAAFVEPLVNANLTWLYLLANRVPEAIDLRASLGAIPAHGLALLDAGIKLSEDNFGSATDHLASALGGDLDRGTWDFSDDLNRLLRLAEKTGYGERLIAWFENTGFADRVAPIYVAFKAYIRNEKLLLDVNPEVRQAAQAIYDRLDAPRRHASKIVPKEQSRRRHAPLRKAK